LVFDLLIVFLCALRRCFFLARRASAYLFNVPLAAELFALFALPEGVVSAFSAGVVVLMNALLEFEILECEMLVVKCWPWNAGRGMNEA